MQKVARMSRATKHTNVLGQFHVETSLGLMMPMLVRIRQKKDHEVLEKNMIEEIFRGLA